MTENVGKACAVRCCDRVSLGFGELSCEPQSDTSTRRGGTSLLRAVLGCAGAELTRASAVAVADVVDRAVKRCRLGEASE